MRNSLRGWWGLMTSRAMSLSVIAGLAAMSAVILGAATTQNPAPGSEPASVNVQPLRTQAIDPILEAGSPDGKWAVYRKTHPAKEIWLRNLATGADRKLIDLPNYSWGLVWSLDGQQLAVEVERDRSNAIYLVDVPSGMSRVLPTEYFTGPGPFFEGGWTSAGELLLNGGIRQPDGSVTRTHMLTSARSAEHREVFLKDQRRVTAIAPDGRRLVVAVQQRLVLYDLATGAEQDLVDGENVVFSPDGKWVAWRSAGNIYAGRIDAAAIRDKIRVGTVPEYINEIVMWWTSDGLAITHGLYDTGILYRIDLDTRSQTAKAPPRVLATNADCPVISPDSKRIAHTYYRDVHGFGVLDVSSGQDKTVPDDDSQAAGCVIGWRSPTVVLTTGSKKVVAFDLTTRTRAALLEGPKAASVDSYSPVRDELVLKNGPTQGTSAVSTLRFDGKEREIARIDRLLRLVVSPDGKQIAYGRRTGDDATGRTELRTASISGSDDRVLLTAPIRNSIWPVEWSPDGHHVLYYDGTKAYEQKLRVLDLNSGKDWPLSDDLDPAFGSSIDSASWSPDGNFLVLGLSTFDTQYAIGRLCLTEAGGLPSPTFTASDTSAPTTAQAPRTKVIVLGTGTPNADPERFGPAVAIIVDDQSYLVDAGVGVVRRAAASKNPALVASNLKRVFLTHLHSDHTLGLPDLMLSPWVLGRSTPIDVYGPRGTTSMTMHIQEAWREDIAQRTYGLEPKHSGVRAYEAVPHEINAGRVYEDDKVKVDAIAVAHGTWPQAFGYRFQTPDRVIVISGDTSPTTTISEACRGCDVLIHEVYSAARARGADWEAYDSAYHTSTKQLAAIANTAQPKLLVLYHQMFRGASGEDLLQEIAAAGYKGRVISAKDLDVY